MRRRVLVLVVLLLASGMRPAQGQIFGRDARTRRPIAYTSLSAGWLTQQEICDPASDACWNFSSAPQWRATLEAPFGNGMTLGLAGTTSRMPLVYASGPLALNGCRQGTSCNADANITQILGLLRIGGGSGFHQVIDIEAGMTLFSNFRDANGGKLGTGRTTQDFTVGIGVGFGYTMSERFELIFLQDFGLIFHKKASGSTQNVAQQRTLRLGLRVALGGGR